MLSGGLHLMPNWPLGNNESQSSVAHISWSWFSVFWQQEPESVWFRRDYQSLQLRLAAASRCGLTELLSGAQQSRVQRQDSDHVWEKKHPRWKMHKHTVWMESVAGSQERFHLLCKHPACSTSQAKSLRTWCILCFPLTCLFGINWRGVLCSVANYRKFK